jgi:hypothetical protein
VTDQGEPTGSTGLPGFRNATRGMLRIAGGALIVLGMSAAAIPAVGAASQAGTGHSSPTHAASAWQHAAKVVHRPETRSVSPSFARGPRTSTLALPPRLSQKAPAISPRDISQIFTVDSSVDSPLATADSKACVDSETVAKCSLRAAIGAADNDTGHVDEVVIPAGMHLTLSEGVLDIINSMVIVGSGASVSGGGSQEVFNESSESDAVPAVQILGLTITDGYSDGEDGGGLDCDEGSLVLDGVSFIGNTDPEGYGAGAYLGYECQTWITDSTFRDNTTPETSSEDEGYGGGLYTDGSTDITKSSFGGPDAAMGNRSYEGSGIYNGGTLVLTDSVVDWNSPVAEGESSDTSPRTVVTDDYGYGIGIYNEGDLDVASSAVEYNFAPNGAAGVGVYNDDLLEITGSTISYNLNDAASDDEYGGAGLGDFGESATLDHDLFQSDDTILSTDSYVSGGAIFSDSDNFSLSDSAVVDTDNRPASSSVTESEVEGGAFYLDNFLASMRDDLISGTSSSAAYVGGGVVYDESGCDDLARQVVSPRRGCGGIAVVDPLVMQDVSISHSSVTGQEIYGGVLDDEGSVQMIDVSIDSTDAGALSSEGCDEDDYGVYGGVLYLDDGFDLNGVSISGTVATASLSAIPASAAPSSTPTCVYGGAIYNDGEGTADDVSINDTSATASGGDGGVLGGAWYNDEELTIRDSQVIGLSVVADDYVEGGLFDNWGLLAANGFTLGNATVRATGGPDAEEPEVLGSVFYNAEQAEVVNGTFGDVSASDPADGDGDWAVADGYDGLLQLTNATIADDSVSGPKGGISLLWVQDYDETTLLNSIVDDPTAPSLSCSSEKGGTISSQGYNLDGGSSCNFNKTGDIENRNPMLRSLADNGGPVETMALVEPAGGVAGSPAINAGTNVNCPDTDARGVVRPQGGRCDIGAYEVPAQGLWLTAGDGGLFHFAAGHYYGSAVGLPLKGPIVAIAATPDHGGYWLAGSDGGVFTYGDAKFRGSIARLPLASAIVGIASTADGLGYWLVSSDGQVFPFGDAVYHGSEDYDIYHYKVVGIAATADGGGYWLVTSGGHVLAFGDAVSYGDASSMSLSAPIVGMAVTPDGHGYWLVAADGGVFDFGDAKYFGSLGGTTLNAPITSIVPTSDGYGYWLVASDGGVFRFGDAQFLGSMAGHGLTAPVSGAASANY